MLSVPPVTLMVPVLSRPTSPEMLRLPVAFQLMVPALLMKPFAPLLTVTAAGCVPPLPVSLITPPAWLTSVESLFRCSVPLVWAMVAGFSQTRSLRTWFAPPRLAPPLVVSVPPATAPSFKVSNPLTVLLTEPVTSEPLITRLGNVVSFARSSVAPLLSVTPWAKLTAVPVFRYSSPPCMATVPLLAMPNEPST